MDLRCTNFQGIWSKGPSSIKKRHIKASACPGEGPCRAPACPSEGPCRAPVCPSEGPCRGQRACRSPFFQLLACLCQGLEIGNCIHFHGAQQQANLVKGEAKMKHCQHSIGCSGPWELLRSGLLHRGVGQVVLRMKAEWSSGQSSETRKSVLALIKLCDLVKIA